MSLRSTNKGRGYSKTLDPFNLISREYVLDTRRSGGVDIEFVARVSYEGSSYDQDGQAEIYWGGDIIPSLPFRRNAQRTVIELWQAPGILQIHCDEELAGISLSDGDLATAHFTIPLLLRNPDTLIRVGQTRDNEDLKQMLEAYIESCLNAILLDHATKLWTKEEFRGDVADPIYGQLDAQLNAWGISVDAGATSAFREYPGKLHEIALQLKEAQSYLLQIQGEEKTRVLAQLGLDLGDLRRMEEISVERREGGGAGLFRIISERTAEADRFIEWLETELLASQAADYLSELWSSTVSRGYTKQEVDLSKAVMETEFKHPMLGIGEFGEVKQ